MVPLVADTAIQIPGLSLSGPIVDFCIQSSGEPIVIDVNIGS